MSFVEIAHRLTGMANERATLWRSMLPRILSTAVGLVLLAASVMKATDMELFISQIGAYGLITQPFVAALGAWGMVAFQFSLGIGLILFYQPRYILLWTIALFLGLTLLTQWAWITGATEECGCYGTWLKSTPKQATLENGAMFAIAVVSRLFYQASADLRNPRRSRAFGAACVTGIALPLVFGFSPWTIPGEGSGVALGEIEITGLRGLNMTHGTYLVVLMNTDCSHCQDLLPEIDMLAEESDIPGVLALSKNNEAQRREFVKKYEPLFPIGQVSDTVFWRLLGSGKMPRILLVQEGKIQKVWDRTVPQKEMIKATVFSQGRKDAAT